MTTAVTVLASDGTTATTPDGSTWTTNTGLNGNAASGWSDMCYSDTLGQWCAVNATSGHSAVSSDGITWTYSSAAINGTIGWCTVIWIDALSAFVAVSNNTGQASNSAISTDGLTWTAHAIGEQNTWQKLAWSPTQGVLVAMSNSGTHQLATSTNGTSWSLVTPPMTSLQALAWDPVLALFCTSCFSTNKSATSPDGSTWTAHSSNSPLNTGNHHDMCAIVGTGGFIVAMQGAVAPSSADGSTWTTHALNDGASPVGNSITYSASLAKYFICIGSGTATQGVAGSTDAATWATTGTLTTAKSWVAIEAAVAAPIVGFKHQFGTVVC